MEDKTDKPQQTGIYGHKQPLGSDGLSITYIIVGSCLSKYQLSKFSPYQATE